MTRYAFSLGLVPVQEWIAEASRSRDLRAGSAFLSWLMAKILATLDGDLRVSIEIPREPDEGWFSRVAAGGFEAVMGETYGIPNRASGFCSDGRRTVSEVFSALEREVVVAAWEEWKDRFLRGPQVIPASRAFWGEVDRYRAEYEAQLGPGGDCPFRVVWVAMPAADGGDEQAQRKAREEVDCLYSDVKRDRPIDTWPAGAPVPKCTVCGRRESAGPAASMHEWRTWHEARDADPWVVKGWRIDPGERLCYVCLARRMAAYAGRGAEFPSTGRVASAPWRAAIQRTGGAAGAALAAFERAVDEGEEKGDLGRALFASDRELEGRGLAAVVAARAGLRRALEGGGGEGSERLASSPPSYLALVAFDGDDLGRHLREDPGGVSAGLHAFAGRAEELLEVCGERAIFYLGGDEGLALLPAGQALEVVTALRREFGERVGGAITWSAGLVFFEQRRPMGGALREARRLLAQAKSVEGKNALGVAVQTASGSRWDLVKRWGAVWERLARAVKAVREGELSSGWAYDVEAFLGSMDEETWEGVAMAPERVRLEVERLLRRRMPRKPKERRDAHRERARALWEELRGGALWERDGPEPARRDGEQFHLVGFLARQLGVLPAADEREAEETGDQGEAA